MTPRSRSAAASQAAPTDQPTGAAGAVEAAAAVELANQVLGKPEPMVLLRQEGALGVIGWVLGRGRAECQEAGQLAHLVGVDVILTVDGVYAVSERTATNGVNGLSRLDARCELFDSALAARAYCEDAPGDEAHRAARVAALDHAIRRWPPLRGGSAVGRIYTVPFKLD